MNIIWCLKIMVTASSLTWKLDVLIHCTILWLKRATKSTLLVKMDLRLYTPRSTVLSIIVVGSGKPYIISQVCIFKYLEPLVRAQSGSLDHMNYTSFINIKIFSYSYYTFIFSFLCGIKIMQVPFWHTNWSVF